MTARVEHVTEPWPTKVERLSLPATIYCECPVCGAGNSQDLYLSYPWLNTDSGYLTLTCRDCEAKGAHTEWSILLKLTVAVEIASCPRDVRVYLDGVFRIPRRVFRQVGCGTEGASPTP